MAIFDKRKKAVEHDIKIIDTGKGTIVMDFGVKIVHMEITKDVAAGIAAELNKLAGISQMAEFKRMLDLWEAAHPNEGVSANSILNFISTGVPKESIISMKELRKRIGNNFKHE